MSEYESEAWKSADARRILACVDACAGLDDALLTPGRFRELLAAAEAAYSLIGQQWVGPSLEVSLQLSRAIARARGEAPPI